MEFPFSIQDMMNAFYYEISVKNPYPSVNQALFSVNGYTITIHRIPTDWSESKTEPIRP